MKRTTTFSLLAGFLFILTSGTIDLSNLDNYANQAVPAYITKDNTTNNPITDEGATLGRVLFYDKKLSSNNTIACANCHVQEFAFGDTSFVSQGVNGTTGRHSMRLINARFSEEMHFFWDERANTLEEQSTMPIQDHLEMGYSGTNGDPDLNQLLVKLDGLDYYDDLFYAAFGDTAITEARIQQALAQFVRSIQSFDSKYDIGRAAANNDMLPFNNFTTNENQGKFLFIAPPQIDANGVRVGGGAGCAACHRAPEFDIDPNMGHNGIIGSLLGGVELNNTKSPTLRDLVNPNNVPNGHFMHNSSFANLNGVVAHYDNISSFPNNPNIFQAMDPRLRPNGNAIVLNLTVLERQQIVAFLRTLTGTDVYTNPKWSDPFDANGDITILGGITPTEEKLATFDLSIFPNPTTQFLNIVSEVDNYQIEVFTISGKSVYTAISTQNTERIDLSHLSNGIYFIKIQNMDDLTMAIHKIIKH